MKNSNKVLIVTVLVLLLIITVIIVSSRIILDNTSIHDWDYSAEDITSKSFDYTDFNGIRADGAWRISIHQSDNYSITVEYPEDLEDKLNVSTWDTELVLENDVRWEHDHCSFRATIGMPRLSSVETEEGASMEIENFNCDELSIQITGAAEIRGNSNNIGNLDIRCDGATHVNLRNSLTENANINIKGASRIVLNMTGGKLTGSAEGASSIVYYGDVSTQDIETAGAVSVHHR